MHSILKKLDLALKSVFVRKLTPVIVLLLLWEIFVRIFHIPTYVLPSVGSILVKLGDLLMTGELLKHTLLTVFRSVAGILIAVVIGVAIGFLMAWYRRVGEALDYLVAATYAIPKVAVIPLLVVWLGVEEIPKLTISVVGALFPILLNTIAGVHSVDTILIKAARDLRANDWQLFKEVILPGALPMFFAGLKIGAGVAFILVVAAEMMVANVGLGYLIASSSSILAVDAVFVGLVVLGILGTLVFAAVDLMERLMIPWHVKVRKAALEAGRAVRQEIL
jgi:NitT/TauT family transport system permease protein